MNRILCHIIEIIPAETQEMYKYQRIKFCWHIYIMLLCECICHLKAPA